jgi:HD-GYP domain-containing protein (c-di-GMP phosphodiesterase class II)
MLQQTMIRLLKYRGNKISNHNKWRDCYAWFIKIDTEDAIVQRRGQLVAMYILLLGSILGYATVENIIHLSVHPDREYTIYLIEEIIIAACFYVFWFSNRKGRVDLTAYTVISFSIIGAASLSDATYLEYLMVIFALPIGISSFIIRPSSSFLFALLATVSYIISSIISGYAWEYNLIAVLSLFALAFMTWVIAQQLEDVFKKNNALYNDLQRSNNELKNAYETTLEGWSHALDLRDRETEGHTQRVTALTMRMAKSMGFSAEELIHIRRGALLHDIGKLGVPEEVLHKRGELTDSEWQIMRRHTQFAYDMIYPISYLHPAIDIPFCHHEKWDGTGYPRKLKGEQIPLSARIFAIVDVYDALSSNRPYREAWPKNKVLEYIRNQSGTHFEPKIVDIFIREIQKS